MAFWRPNWLNTCATTATSPSHEGVEGTEVGAIWTWTEGCVILFLCLLEKGKFVIVVFPFSRRHSFCLFCQYLDDLPTTNLGYTTSLRISWVYKGSDPVEAVEIAKEFDLFCSGKTDVIIVKLGGKKKIKESIK